MQAGATQTKEKIKGISLRLVIVIGVFSFILFTLLFVTNEVVLEGENSFDTRVFTSLRTITNGSTTNIMLLLTFFGSTKFLLPAYILLTAYYMFLKKNTIRSLNISAIALSSTLLLHFTKNVFQRHRPSQPLIDNVIGFSYPSGHSFSAFTFSGIIIYVIWKSELKTIWKWVAAIALFVFASLIAVSRVYLHVHYASDVIAGFCLSFLWLSICIYVLERFTKRRNDNHSSS